MKKTKLLLFMALILVFSTACVDQSGAAVTAEKASKRIIATSMATVAIMEKLDIDLVAVPNSDNAALPERYADLPKIGMAMMPDIELIKTLKPDYVFGPSSLISDLLPKYDAAKIDYGFLNLNNVPGMYKSIEDLGQLLDRQEQATALLREYDAFMVDYNSQIKDKKAKKVLILMGLPGSYVVATEHSYVGSLVKLAGGENVYAGSDQQFMAVNTEDMLTKDPDVILRTAHALPDDVMTMFAKDFAENDIWQHFRCVEAGEVYDLDYKKFGMSANFNYPAALTDLKEVLYE